MFCSKWKGLALARKKITKLKTNGVQSSMKSRAPHSIYYFSEKIGVRQRRFFSFHTKNNNNISLGAKYSLPRKGGTKVLKRSQKEDYWKKIGTEKISKQLKIPKIASKTIIYHQIENQQWRSR